MSSEEIGGVERDLSEIAAQNRKFLLSGPREVFDEIVELVNDAVDYVAQNAKSESAQVLATTRAMHFFGYHSLMPGSYSILANLLLGGLPSCFRELRFMTEMLAKSFLADAHESGDSLFTDKLEALQDEKRSEGVRKREIDFIKEFDERLSLNSRVTRLWGKLSEEGHARRYVRRLTDRLADTGTFPSYSLVLPMAYAVGDENELRELAVYVREFRQILTPALRA